MMLCHSSGGGLSGLITRWIILAICSSSTSGFLPPACAPGKLSGALRAQSLRLASHECLQARNNAALPALCMRSSSQYCDSLNVRHARAEGVRGTVQDRMVHALRSRKSCLEAGLLGFLLLGVQAAAAKEDPITNRLEGMILSQLPAGERICCTCLEVYWQESSASFVCLARHSAMPQRVRSWR